MINGISLRDVYSNDRQISDFQVLRKLRLKYPRNPNKIINVGEFIGRLQLDYFVISETQLDSSFPSAQFHVVDFEIRNRWDRNKSGVGLIEFVKKGILTKRLKDLEKNLSETICTEITISKKRWFCMSVYRPPSSSNIDTFFSELTISLSKAVNKFDNPIIMGDFNLDITKEDCSDFDKLEELRDAFNLTNLLNPKHVISIITNRQLIYFSRASNYLFKKPPQLELD